MKWFKKWLLKIALNKIVKYINKNVMKSNETTWSGILSLVLLAVAAMIDGDPTTVPDWGFISAIIPLIVGLFRARDNNKTSEKAGAK